MEHASPRTTERQPARPASARTTPSPRPDSRLALGRHDDAAEREADATAERVMGNQAVQRMARAGGPAGEGAAPGHVGRVLRSAGRPLDARTRAFFEPRFGRSFARVQVHTDRPAQHSARAIQAHAYTAGEHVVFDAGQYAPDSDAGRRLLAHELTHVVQQDGRAGVVQREANFFAMSDEIDPDATPASLYESSFNVVMFNAFGLDKCSENLGKKLHRYVLAHPDPYQFIKDVFEEIPSKWEDNVAADFMSQLSEMELMRFAQSDAGRALLDVLFQAMMTGDVSGFERMQAARIEQFGTAAAAAQRNPIAGLAVLGNENSPESLVERFRAAVTASGLDGASVTLAEGLRAYIDIRPSPYAFLRRVFDALPSRYEDNVAADFLASMDNARLDAFAAPAESRPLLDALYEALITGDVSRFERFEAERILQVKNAQTPLSVFQAYQTRRRIFPVKYQKFLRDCYSAPSAELLPDGRVRAWYASARIWQCDEFKDDVATLHATADELMNGIYLKSDEVVSVRLYDGDDHTPQDIPAIALLDYANESKNRTLGLAQQAFLAGLTLPMGGLPEAAGARALAIADRIAFGIAIVSSLVNDNREWIAELPGGQALLDAVDSANKLAGYYGWTRLGVDGLRIVGGTLRKGWQAWEAAPKPSLSADQASVIQKIEGQVDTVLGDVAKADEQAAAKAQSDAAADPRVQERAKETAEKAATARKKADEALTDARAISGQVRAATPLSVAWTGARVTSKLFSWAYWLVKSRRLSFEGFLKQLEKDGLIASVSELSQEQRLAFRNTYDDALLAVEGGQQLYAKQIWGRLSKRARNALGRDAVDLAVAENVAKGGSADDLAARLEAEAAPQGRVRPVMETTYSPPDPRVGESQTIVTKGRVGDLPRTRPGTETKYPLGRDVGLPGYDRAHLEGVMTIGDELNILYTTKSFNQRVMAEVEADIRRESGDLYYEISATTHVTSVTDGVTIKVVDSVTWKVYRRTLGTDEFEMILNRTERP